MITLEKILQEVDSKGCIADEREIAQILEQMADIPLGEILDAAADQEMKKMSRLIIEVLCEENGLCEGDVRALTYTDVLCMLRKTQIVNDGVSFRYQGIYWLRCMLQGARGGSVLISRYLSIGAEGLFSYLSNSHTDRKAADAVCDRCRKACRTLDMYGMDWSIGEALEEMRRRGEVVWKPWRSWELHRQKIHEMYQGWKCLLMDPFRVVYPEKFCLDNVAGRYRCAAGGEYPEPVILSCPSDVHSSPP